MSLQQVEERVLVRARNLSKQLNVACRSAVNYVQNSPRLQPLLEQVLFYTQSFTNTVPIAYVRMLKNFN